MARKKAHRSRTTPPPGPQPVAMTGGGSAPDGAVAVVATPVRRTPVILKDPAKPRIGEVAGGTAAECTAVCCCCPCAIVNFAVLTVVQVPAGLCKKAIRARQRRRAAAARKRRAAAFLGPDAGVAGAGGGSVPDEEEEGSVVALNRGQSAAVAGREMWPARPPSAEATQMEKEMRAQFYNAGFWRSPSQRENQER